MDTYLQISLYSVLTITDHRSADGTTVSLNFHWFSTWHFFLRWTLKSSAVNLPFDAFTSDTFHHAEGTDDWMPSGSMHIISINEGESQYRCFMTKNVLHAFKVKLEFPTFLQKRSHRIDDFSLELRLGHYYSQWLRVHRNFHYFQIH
jgi:hypothetical protein